MSWTSFSLLYRRKFERVVSPFGDSVISSASDQTCTPTNAMNMFSGMYNWNTDGSSLYIRLRDIYIILGRMGRYRLEVRNWKYRSSFISNLAKVVFHSFHDEEIFRQNRSGVGRYFSTQRRSKDVCILTALIMLAMSLQCWYTLSMFSSRAMYSFLSITRTNSTYRECLFAL